MNPDTSDDRQSSTDLEHLRLHSIFYYVLSGLAFLCSFFPIIHLTVGIMIVAGGFPQAQQPQKGGPQAGPPPELFGWIFIGVSVACMLLGFASSVCLFLTGRFLRRQRRYLFCFVMAVVACLQQPFGTVLGVFTIIVLIRPTVKALFQQNLEAQQQSKQFNSDEHWN